MSRTPPPLPSGPPPQIENSLSAVVVKEYAPIESNHIQLQIGDTIKVTDFGEKLFWYGTSSSGEQGLFPQSHVEVRGRGRGRGGLIRGRGGPEGRGGARHSSYVPSNPNPNPTPITPPVNSTSPTNMRPKSGYTNNSPLNEPRTGGVPVRSASPSVPRPLPNPSDNNNNNNNGANSPARGAPRGRGVVRALSQSFGGTTSTSQPSPSNSPLRPSELNKSTNAQPNNNIQKKINNNNNNNIINDNSNNGNSNDSINENLNNEQNANQSNQDQPKKKTREDLRNDTLQEIYITEKGYIEDLETLINVFIFPLRTMGILQESILYNIFSNVEVLINCNREMLKALEEKMNFVKENEEVSIGSCFTMLADYFKMYKVYCANQSTSLTTVDTQLKKNSQFKKKLDVCHSDPRCRGLFLQSFLIKPIQRVCKYPLLLRELIRYTPEDHPDYEPLQSAFNKINEVVTNINEGQREAEGLQYILDLQKLIEGIDTLVEPGRRFHKEGDLTFYKNVKSKHGEKRHVFFFSDLILLTVKKGEKRYEHKLSIPLENCTLIVLADTDYIKNAFELSQKQLKRPCILSGDSSEELNQWTREIKNLIKLYQKKQIELKKKGISSSEDQLGVIQKKT